MAKRESYVTDQLSLYRAYRLSTGTLEHEQVYRVPFITGRIDDRVPARRKKPALPALFPTDMKKFSWTTINGTCTVRTFDTYYDRLYVDDPIGYRYTGSTAWNTLPGVSMSGNGTPSATRNLELEWDCARKLRAKILNSSLAIPVVIAEAKTTVSWIAQRSSDAARMIQAVKAAKWSTLRKTLLNVSNEYKKLSKSESTRQVVIHSNGRMTFSPKFKGTKLPESPPKGWSTKTAAGRWLEVRYAITPLLSDVDGLARNLAQFLYDNRMELMHKWATAVDVPPDKASMTLECAGRGVTSGRNQYTFTWKSARVVKYSVYYVYSKWLAAFHKLQLTNAPNVVWETVPYSFVFDWLVNVGDYLALADATVGCEFLSGTLSYRVAGVPQSFPVVFVPGTRRTDIDVQVAPSTWYKIYEREKLSAFPNFLPTVRSPLSTAHVIDALALIRVTKP